MTTTRSKKAKAVADAARKAKEKVEALAAAVREEDARLLAEEARGAARDVAQAAADLEAEAEREAERLARLEREDPSLWTRFKKWFE